MTVGVTGWATVVVDMPEVVDNPAAVTPAVDKFPSDAIMFSATKFSLALTRELVVMVEADAVVVVA